MVGEKVGPGSYGQAVEDDQRAGAEDHGAVQGEGRRLHRRREGQPGHRSREAEAVMFSAEFRCATGCSNGRFPLDQIIYRCPTCGGLLEVVHDLDALRTRSAADWRALFAERWKSLDEPWGSGVWGKHEWVAPQLDRTQRRVDARGRHAPRVTTALCGRARRRRGSRQAVRHLAHRLVQGPRHDRARVDGQADDRQRPADSRDRVRIDRRHVGSARRLCSRGRHPLRRDPPAREDLDGAARPAARRGRARARDRHRLRRLHAPRAGARRARGRLPRELDELAAHRGPEDRRDRACPAARLAGPRLGRDPGRQSRQVSARSRPGST